MNVVIPVEVPESFREALTAENGDAALPRWALEAMVVEALRQELITERLAGHVLGLSFVEREGFLAKHGIVHDYSEDELQAQQDAVSRAMLRP